MIVLNFSHTLTEAQRNSLKAHLNIDDKTWKNVDIIDVSCYLQIEQDFSKQIEQKLTSIPLSSDQWSSEPLIVVPPPIAHSALLVVAGISAICGYFPPIVRLKKKKNSLPPIYDVAEVIDINAFKSKMRSMRK